MLNNFIILIPYKSSMIHITGKGKNFLLYSFQYIASAVTALQKGIYWMTKNTVRFLSCTPQYSLFEIAQQNNAFYKLHTTDTHQPTSIKMNNSTMPVQWIGLFSTNFVDVEAWGPPGTGKKIKGQMGGGYPA